MPPTESFVFVFGVQKYEKADLQFWLIFHMGVKLGVTEVEEIGLK